MRVTVVEAFFLSRRSPPASFLDLQRGQGLTVTGGIVAGAAETSHGPGVSEAGRDQGTTDEDRYWAEMAERRRRAMGRYRGQFTVPEDFDEPLPPEVQRLFEGDDEPQAS